jgi:hypothetical protein
MNLNYQLSLEIAKAIDAQLGQCYYNAFRALAMVSSNPVYVQGLATSPKLSYIPLDHGWIEDKGKIIDPTWYDMVDVHYYAIQRWTWKEVTDIVMEKPTLPLKMKISNDEYIAAINNLYAQLKS